MPQLIAGVVPNTQMLTGLVGSGCELGPFPWPDVPDMVSAMEEFCDGESWVARGCL